MSEENAGMTWHAKFNRLFASPYPKGEAAIHAARINEAVCGFVLCVTAAVAAVLFTALPSVTVR
ncbi:MAG: hypothetical protein ABW198_01500 [Pseudorhodoplanes sp.]